MFGMVREGITFDDVLLIPRRSRVFSRKIIDTKTKLSKNISLNIPIVSANMDTVTDARMARAMAEAGGIGIIHRFLSIEDQVAQVRKVKRAENVLIEDPLSVSPEDSLRDIRSIIKREDVSSVLVIGTSGKLEGIITARDLLFEDGDEKLAHEVMTKKLLRLATKFPFKTLERFSTNIKLKNYLLSTRSEESWGS